LRAAAASLRERTLADPAPPNRNGASPRAAVYREMKLGGFDRAIFFRSNSRVKSRTRARAPDHS
jgi:hypothetical protein